MATASQARTKCKSWAGLKEGPAVDKAIMNPWNKKTHEHRKSKTSKWCAIMLASLLIQIGVKTLCLSAGCKQQMQWFKSRKRWKPKGTKPQVGWFVFFDFKNNGKGNPTHCGFITSVDYKKKGFCYSEEGNKSNKVGYRHFSYKSYKYIVGYGVPYYK